MHPERVVDKRVIAAWIGGIAGILCVVSATHDLERYSLAYHAMESKWVTSLSDREIQELGQLYGSLDRPSERANRINTWGQTHQSELYKDHLLSGQAAGRKLLAAMGLGFASLSFGMGLRFPSVSLSIFKRDVSNPRG